MPAVLRGQDGRTYPLDDFNLIGRSQDASICFNEPGISRQHATIRREGTQYFIMDLASANGSYVNDTAISSARALNNGDKLQFGPLIFFFDQQHSENTGHFAGGQTEVFTSASVRVRTSQITLLVGDLCDFTKLSAQLSAEQVAALLREWYADCEQILKPRGATIDKFMGDGVFAYWPSVDPVTRANAAECARLLSRQEASQSLTRKTLLRNRGIVVQCNVGLHIGEVAFGSMGRGVNTAVGEAVNVTFRIESLTRKLQQPVLASAAFVKGWPDAERVFEYQGIHPVKGQPMPVEVYSLISPPALPQA
jgi:adenylate cyclase